MMIFFLGAIGAIESLKGQLYLFAIFEEEFVPSTCDNAGSVFFLDNKKEWQQFKRNGNVTKIVKIISYQV